MGGDQGPSRRAGGWGAAWILALSWGILPALPALWAGGLLGAPWTDLYPSVWGLGWFVDQQPGLPHFTTDLAAPDGMGFYYSSPLHGWLATPLIPLIGLVASYNVTILLARVGTVLAAYGAGRGFGLGPGGALVAAAVYGTAPFFHGYAVEGIVEGTDGWALALYAWVLVSAQSAGRPEPARAALHVLLQAVTLALTVMSSWYLGMVGCALGALAGVLDRRAWAGLLGGLVLSAPALLSFGAAFPGVAPLDPAIRTMMGARLTLPRPGILSGQNPFAMNTYLGFVTVGLGLWGAWRTPRRGLVLLMLAVGFFVLSTGWGPWYELPIVRSVRFVYRWHAGTLLVFAALAGLAADRGSGRLWAALIVAEGLCLSPVEPVIPGSDASVPAIYDRVRGPVLLELPGPVAMPPGEVNRSRPRARYLLYFQHHHGAASPWAPDFNGVGTTPPAAWLLSFASWDPLEKRTPIAPDLDGARAAGVQMIMVHRGELGPNAAGLEVALVEGGARLLETSSGLALYEIGEDP